MMQMMQMSVRISFRVDKGRRRDEIELGSAALEKLGRAWGNPRALYTYVALLVLPEQYWWSEQTVGFVGWEVVQKCWQDKEHQERMIEVIAQLAQLRRQLGQVLWGPRNEEVRQEMEIWAGLAGEFEQALNPWPMTAKHKLERGMLAGAESQMVKSVWRALQESTWLGQVQARQGLAAWQGYLTREDNVEGLLWGLVRLGLVNLEVLALPRVEITLPEVARATRIRT